MLAMVLILGAMAAFHFWFLNDDTIDSRFSFGGDRIGVVHLRGFISGSRDVNDWIESLEQDDKIRGVVLRIDSPGGAVAPSQEMFSAVRRLAATKPVYVSMGSVAASGGYYVACGGTKLWANRATLTGSIGVKAQLTDMQDLLSKIGIREQTVTSGDLKNTGTVFRPMNEKERSYMQGLVDDIHEQFVSDIAESRKMSREDLLPYADGRAMTGMQAHRAGLVDELGGFDDVVLALGRDLGMEPDFTLVEGPIKPKSLINRLAGVLELAENLLLLGNSFQSTCTETLP